MKLVAILLATTLMGGCASLEQTMRDAQEPVYNPDTSTQVHGQISGGNWSVRF